MTTTEKPDYSNFSFHNFTGKVKWCKHREDNRDMGSKEYPDNGEKYNGVYQLDLFMSPQDIRRAISLGLTIRREKKEPFAEFVTFKRQHQLTNTSGEVRVLGAPKLFDQNAVEIVGSKDNIWNDSEIGVSIMKRDNGPGRKPTFRLQGIQLINLVVPPESETSKQNGMFSKVGDTGHPSASDFVDAPSPSVKKPVKAKVPALDDEIPF